jgi:hypothetical protein
MRKHFLLMTWIALLVFLPRYLCAAPDNWRIAIRADNGRGQYFGPLIQLGVYPASTDGFDASYSPGADGEVAYSTDFSQTTRWVAAFIPGEARTLSKDILSPALPQSYPDSTKRWELRVAALANATSDPMRLCLYTILADVPPATAEGLSLAYRLVMIDNKGMPGASQNGKVWSLPIPTAHSSSPYWTLPQADWLPILRLSAASHEAMISEGYVMRFEQYQLSIPGQAVPEPAGLSALGIGVAGLVGWAIRRRR